MPLLHDIVEYDDEGHLVRWELSLRTQIRERWRHLTWPLMRHRHNRKVVGMLMKWARPHIDGGLSAMVIRDKLDYGARYSVGVSVWAGSRHLHRRALVLSQHATRDDFDTVVSSLTERLALCH